MISFLLLLVAPYALCLLIAPPPSNIINNSVPARISRSNDTASLLVPGVASCIGRTYGFDLGFDSCINAWGKMPRTLEPIAYGDRSLHLAASVPVRYQSDDGLCAIDLRARHGDVATRGDVARGVDVSDAAHVVIEKCIKNRQQSTTGGSISGFSMYSLPCSPVEDVPESSHIDSVRDCLADLILINIHNALWHD